MAPKQNPKNLNPLQLRTLAIFQRLAQLDDYVAETGEDGSIMIENLPHPHGDHFHLGNGVVHSRDASGLTNQSVWLALERKGLIEAEFPFTVRLTQEALSYPTGSLGSFIHHSDH